jgi:hypothetical protein
VPASARTTPPALGGGGTSRRSPTRFAERSSSIPPVAARAAR